MNKVESSPSPAEMKLYRKAVAAYHQKSYLESAESFETIRTATKNKRFATMALYGLACSKLMVAKTPNEYNNAMMLWLQWVENAPEEFDYENPVLVGALLQEKMLFSNIPLASDKAQEESPEPMVSRWLLIRSKKELDRLRKELDASRVALEKRKKINQAQQKEIAKLKRQIKALETIDQKIQKKKNAIPSTDSGTTQ
ncbi:MAG: hypothetical protein PVH87_02470 [Desulfobacteraceae bacterium]|jgi:hypothetical protein